MDVPRGRGGGASVRVRPRREFLKYALSPAELLLSAFVATTALLLQLIVMYLFSDEPMADMRRNSTLSKTFSSSRYVTTQPCGKHNHHILSIRIKGNASKLIVKQRNLNNAFAYDLVPSVEVVSAALRAARRVNDFPTAVRIFEGGLSLYSPPEATYVLMSNISFAGVRAKVENEAQYKQYLEQLEAIRTELGISLQEELYPKNE